MRFVLAFCLLLFASIVWGQGVNLYMVGHSLVNTWQGSQVNTTASQPKIIAELFKSTAINAVGEAQAPPGTGIKQIFKIQLALLHGTKRLKVDPMIT